MTHKRVVAVVISIWVFSALATLLNVFIQTKTPIVISVILIFCFTSTTFIYVRIYLAVRRHANLIQAMQVQQLTQNGENMSNIARLRKSAVGTFYVYLVFFICFLPQYGIFVAVLISGTNTTVDVLLLYSWTQMFLNSSLNPLIYCWKMTHIRQAVINILRDACPSHG